MNLAKAKEYFSAYYEGSLDKGLRQTFETHLRTDAQTQAEYRAFERTMMDLEALGRVEIEPPIDLHDRISARIDKMVWDQKQERAPFFSTWWRTLTVAGVAAAGFAIAIFQVSTHRGPEMNVGGVPLPTPQSSAPTFKGGIPGGGVEVSYPALPNQSVTIRDQHGKVLQTVSLEGGLKDKALSNTDTKAQLMSIEPSDQKAGAIFVALPGKESDASTAGKGSLKDLAVAIAGHYGKPVVLEVSDAEKPASWTFESVEALSAATKSVQQLGLQTEQHNTGEILITDH